MAKGYWIVRVDISNPDAYQNYIKANGEAFKKFGAKFLVRGGKYETFEGGARARNAVLEFPSYEQAIACYRSPEYQRAMALREGAASADLIVIEGYDGAQP